VSARSWFSGYELVEVGRLIWAVICGLLGGFVCTAPILAVSRLAVRPGTIAQRQSILFGVMSIAMSLGLSLVVLLVGRQLLAGDFLIFGVMTVVSFLGVICFIVMRGSAMTRGSASGRRGRFWKEK
jgi:hypothetical protein